MQRCYYCKRVRLKIFMKQRRIADKRLVCRNTKTCDAKTYKIARARGK